MAAGTSTARRPTSRAVLRIGAVALTLAVPGCGSGDDAGDRESGCAGEGRLTVPGPSDETASMTAGFAGERVSGLFVRPDGAVRLERRGLEPACYSVSGPEVVALDRTLPSFSGLRRSYGPRPAPARRLERTVSVDGYSVRSVDGAARPRRLTRIIAALQRVTRAAP